MFVGPSARCQVGRCLGTPPSLPPRLATPTPLPTQRGCSRSSLSASSSSPSASSPPHLPSCILHPSTSIPTASAAAPSVDLTWPLSRLPYYYYCYYSTRINLTITIRYTSVATLLPSLASLPLPPAGPGSSSCGRRTSR